MFIETELLDEEVEAPLSLEDCLWVMELYQLEIIDGGD